MGWRRGCRADRITPTVWSLPISQVKNLACGLILRGSFGIISKVFWKFLFIYLIIGLQDPRCRSQKPPPDENSDVDDHKFGRVAFVGGFRLIESKKVRWKYTSGSRQSEVYDNNLTWGFVVWCPTPSPISEVGLTSSNRLTYELGFNLWFIDSHER